MRSTLHNAPFIHDEDSVGPEDGREAVRDHDLGLPQAERAIEEAENARQYREPDNEGGVALQDAVVNDVAIDKGIGDADCGHSRAPISAWSFFFGPLHYYRVYYRRLPRAKGRRAPEEENGPCVIKLKSETSY